MTIIHCRIALALLLIWSIFLPGFVLPYILVWFTLLEILNRRAEYTSQKNYKRLNIVFVVYTFLLMNRFWHIPEGGQMGREIINRCEHLLFSFVVCLAIMQFLRFRFFKVKSFTKALVITTVVFESIGVLNEIYQASWEARDLSFYFSEDAKHDMLSNLAGNIVFLAYAIPFYKWEPAPEVIAKK